MLSHPRHPSVIAIKNHLSPVVEIETQSWASAVRSAYFHITVLSKCSLLVSERNGLWVRECHRQILPQTLADPGEWAIHTACPWSQEQRCGSGNEPRKNEGSRPAGVESACLGDVEKREKRKTMKGQELLEGWAAFSFFLMHQLLAASTSRSKSLSSTLQPTGRRKAKSNTPSFGGDFTSFTTLT